eukprot:6177518-Pleurochrysis_carterae.AAC.2
MPIQSAIRGSNILERTAVKGSVRSLFMGYRVCFFSSAGKPFVPYGLSYPHPTCKANLNYIRSFPSYNSHSSFKRKKRIVIISYISILIQHVGAELLGTSSYPTTSKAGPKLLTAECLVFKTPNVRNPFIDNFRPKALIISNNSSI